jgi:hypothetical protein
MRAVIYVDRPTQESVAAARRWRAEIAEPAAPIVALDAAARRGIQEIPIADFFAGDLRTPDGEAVSLAAWRLAGIAGFNASDEVLLRTPRLAAMNERLGRHTLRLFLAKRLWWESMELLVRALAAEALAQGAPARLLVRHPSEVPLSVIAALVPGVELRAYGAHPLRRRWASFARAVGGYSVRRAKRWLAATRTPSPASTPLPAVLITHEDDLTPDRTVRSQPYWIDAERPAERFRALMLPVHDRFTDPTPAALAALGVETLSEAALGHALDVSATDPATALLAREARAAVAIAMESRGPSAHAAMHAFGLLEYARLVLAVARARNVRCLFTGEPHLVQADAMAIVAELTGIPLVAHQYSNLGFVAPAMCVTADEFLLFSRHFEPIWNVPRASSRRYTEVGYLWDAAFDRIRPRADELRAQLRALGAETIVAYFDESVQNHKFGVISPEDHRGEILTLAQRVLDDPRFAVIVKSQFEWNCPSKRYANEEPLREARATGRYVELLRGHPRNGVFPAEAAMAADFALGHMVGATAALEAALAGCRTLIIDAHGQVRHRRDLYERADVVYPSIDETLDAIDRHRAGDPCAAALGDWSEIVPELDAFRDGRAAWRMREAVERALFSGSPN